MATTIAQATEEVVSPHKTVKIAGLQIHETRNGTVAFINTHYVSQKLIDIMVHILNDERYNHGGSNYGHGIYSVVFRIDNMPVMPKGRGQFEEVPWLWVEASKSCICNVRRCLEVAFEQALDTHDDFKHSEHMSVYMAVWQQILSGFLHEAHHAKSFMDDAMKLLTDKKAMEKEEAAADEYSRIALYDLAKRIDIEPDFGKHIEEMYEDMWALTWEDIKITPEKDRSAKMNRYIICQDRMRQMGGAWFMEATKASEDDHSLPTYKAMLHYFSGADKDDPEWNMEATPTHTETVVHENTPSMEDAHGNVGVPHQEAPNGFQGAVPPQQQQQNMGYPPKTQPEPQYQQQQPQYQQQQNQPVPPQGGGMPKAPEGAYGQAGPVAPNYQQPNVPAGTDHGVNPNCQVGANMYPASTLTPTQMQEVVKGLYYKIYAQIFQSCGFNPMNGQGQPFFMQSAKIVEPIMLTEEEQKIVHGMECYDANGKIQLKAKVDNWISGRFVDGAKMLPGYVLTMSDMNGCQIIRKFIPQNPWKTNQNGEYSKTALLAQQGTHIMWIVDPNAKESQFARRIIGGAFETNVGGSWQPVC